MKKGKTGNKQESRTGKKKQAFPVIGIGASAGGPETQGAEEGLPPTPEDSRQPEKEIGALLSAARRVLEPGSYQEAAWNIFQACREMIGAPAGYIALDNPETHENEPVFLETGGLACTVAPDLPMPIRGLREEVYSTGRAVYNNAYMKSEHTRFLPAGHAPLENVLFAPLNIRGEVTGLLGLANKPGGFTQKDAHLAAGFAELAAIALAHRKAEEAQREANEKLRALFQASPLGIASFDTQGRVTSWNPAAEEVFSWRQEEVLGLDPPPFLPEEGREEAWSTLQRVLHGETVTGREFRLRRKNGELFDASLSVAPLFDAEGRVYGSVGIVEDVTERKQKEQALRESEQRYRSLVELSPDAILVHCQGRYVFGNPAAVELFGADTPQDLMGKQVLDLVHPAYREMVRQRIKRASAGEPTELREVKVLRLDGQPVDIEAAAVPVTYRGEPAIQVMFRDISARKQAEEAVRRAHAELELRVEERTAALRRALEQVQWEVQERLEAEEALRESQERLQFLASQLISAQEMERKRVSQELHDDLGQAMVALRMRLNRIKRLTPPESGLQEDLDEVLGYLMEVIHKVRRISRDLSPTVLEDLGLTVALRQLFEDFERFQGIKVEPQIDDIQDVLPKKSHIMIYRIFQESLTNVYKHAEATRVTVAVNRRADRITFALKDNGKGFDLEELTRKGNSQLGLGLASMAERVRILGSELCLVSRKSQGTSIAFDVVCQGTTPGRESPDASGREPLGS